jgi:hypothetical protein
MRNLAERTLFLTALAMVACSERSAAHEDVGVASEALAPLGVGAVRELLDVPSSHGYRILSGDFNNDGLRDVMWRHLGSNQMSISLMAGTSILEQGPVIPGPPGDDWIAINAVGDLNLDGMTDIVWYNVATKRLTVWLMRGTEPFERGPEIPAPPGEGWLCAPALDFNHDGMADVLWYNPATKKMIVWLMRGTVPYLRGPEIPGPEEDGWFASFAADFDFDGMADVFMYNPDKKRMAVWLMAGTAVRLRGPELPVPPPNGWKLYAVGVFNNGNMIDLRWFDPGAGRTTVTLMAGTHILEQGPPIAGPGGDWILGNATDTDGDGISDMIWLSGDPLRIMVWLWSGTTPRLLGPAVPGPAALGR